MVRRFASMPSYHVYLSVVMASTINLLSSLQSKRYFICPIGFAFLTAVIPLAAGRIGYDEAQTYCWYTRKLDWKIFIMFSFHCSIN